MKLQPVTVDMINGVIERTGFFKNHQELIKFSVMYLVLSEAEYNTSVNIVTNFLKDPEDLRKLKEELEELRRKTGMFDDAGKK